MLFAGHDCARDGPERLSVTFNPIIVPLTAGGGNDLLARVLADKLQKRWGQPVIVEHKPGAGGGKYRD